MEEKIHKLLNITIFKVSVLIRVLRILELRYVIYFFFLVQRSYFTVFPNKIV